MIYLNHFSSKSFVASELPSIESGAVPALVSAVVIWFSVEAISLP